MLVEKVFMGFHPFDCSFPRSDNGSCQKTDGFCLTSVNGTVPQHCQTAVICQEITGNCHLCQGTHYSAPA